MKKFNFAAFILCLLLVASVTLGIIYREDLKLMFSGQKLYTASQYQEAYNAGKEDGYKDREQNQETIDSLRLELSAKDSSLANKETTLQAYSRQVETISNQVNELNNEINNLDAELLELTTTNSNNLERISEIEAEKAELEQQVIELEGQNEILILQVGDLQLEIERLNGVINRLKLLMPEYVDEDEALIRFYADNELIDFMVVNKGTVLSADDIPNVSLSGPRDVFNGWTLNNNLTDPIGLTINNNTDFIANITHYYYITVYTQHYVSETNMIYGSYDSNYYASTSEIATPEDYSTPNADFLFKYFTINDEPVSLSNLILENNLVLTASYERKDIIAFNGAYRVRMWHLQDGNPILQTYVEIEDMIVYSGSTVIKQAHWANDGYSNYSLNYNWDSGTNILNITIINGSNRYYASIGYDKYTGIFTQESCTKYDSKFIIVKE